MLISTLISGWPFHPCYWGASIKNSSADFNYYRRTVDGRKDAAQHVDVSFFSFLFFSSLSGCVSRLCAGRHLPQEGTADSYFNRIDSDEAGRRRVNGGKLTVA